MYNALVSLVFVFVKDPETVHRLSLHVLRVIGFPLWAPLFGFIFAPRDEHALHQSVFGLSFKNPIGLAAGFDKNAEAVSGLTTLGFSFLELGSVTSEAQEGNPRQRIFRFPKDHAVINRMGFNNHGRMAMKKRLHGVRHSVPLGISLGKLKTVELADAPEEYLRSYESLYEYGDYFAINVSSPNTPGLRALQDKDALMAIVGRLNEYRNTQAVRKPLLIKIAPDLTNEALDEVLAVCKAHAIDGIIATNTTITRDGLSEESTETGGLSGKPLREKSTEIIRYLYKKMPELPIIGVGGIFTAEDAYEKICAGASLVQVYTGFIYEGPFVVKNIHRGLMELLHNNGFQNVQEAVGSAHRV